MTLREHEPRMTAIKRRIFELLEGTDSNDRYPRIVGTGIIAVIVVNVAAVCLETVPELEGRFESAFHTIESVSLAVFTLEYVLRLLTCTSSSRYRHTIRGRLRFALSPLAVVDLLVILPNLLAMTLGVDLRSVRAFRLIRLSRILKVGRYSRSLKTLGAVLESKRAELTVTAVCIGFLLVIMSSVLYFIEHESQPEVFSSIPETMWWAVITLTTVGYGDVYPVTALGRVLGGIVAVTGIGIFALPAGILASGFSSVLTTENTSGAIPRACPHCGKGLVDPPTAIDPEDFPRAA